MGRAISDESYSEALWDDEALTSLTHSLVDLFGARSALLQWISRDGHAHVLSHSGHFSDDHLRTYAERFVALDPWLAATHGREFQNVATNLEDVVPVGEFVRSAFYNEFIRPIGDDTCRGIGIRMDNHWGTGVVALLHGRSSSSFDDGDVAALDAHGPRLRRLLSARGRLAALEGANSAFQSMLHHVTQAMLLVRGDGFIIFANAAAEAWLREGRLFACRGGKLDLKGPQAQDIRTALARAADGGDSAMASLLLACPTGRKIVATFLPVAEPLGARQALLLMQPLSKPRPCALHAQLVRLFDLSPAEASVAILVAEGIALGEIASRRSVSITTVRSQLRAVTAKLRCHRQAEVAVIVHAVANLPGGNNLSAADEM